MILPIALSLVFTPGDPTTIKDELEKFQGNWILVATVENGKETQDGKTVLVIKGDTFMSKGGEFSGKLVLDPSKKHLDLLRDGDAKRRILALYRIDGDTLQLCVGGDKRPVEFKDKLAIYKRDTPK